MQGELAKTGVPHCNAARRAKQFHLGRHALDRTVLARLHMHADGHARGPSVAARAYPGSRSHPTAERLFSEPGMTLGEFFRSGS
jgi:hypothetical protein